jgi:prophage regulatory protein
MRLINYRELAPRKGITYHRDHLRRKIQAGEFPAPVALSPRRIAWVEQEVDQWLEQRVAQRDGRQLRGVDCGGDDRDGAR